MSKILHCRYSSAHVAFCLPTALQNVTQRPDITGGMGIGIIHGVHDFNLQDEDNQLDGAEITNAIVCLVNARFAAGTPGHFIAQTDIDVNGERIEEGDPVYVSFTFDQGDAFSARINVPRIGRNTFALVYCTVTIPNDDQLHHHWLSCLRKGDKWYITGGEQRSRLIEVSHSQLMVALFDPRGRELLDDAVSEVWPLGTSVTFVDDNFLHMPIIQLREPKNWDGVPNDIIVNSNPWTVVTNRSHRSLKYHTIQIVRPDTRGKIREIHINNLDASLAALTE